MSALDRAVSRGLSSVITWTISVKRVQSKSYCGYTSASGKKIEIYDTYKTSSCVFGVFGHEIVHSWDFKKGINRKFAKYVGATSFPGYDVGDETPPIYADHAPTSAKEDFAESVTEYVYNQGRSNEGILPTEKRWKFVDTLLTTGTILSFAPNFAVSCNSSIAVLETLWNSVPVQVTDCPQRAAE